ncbi:M1 family metallopeptidase [Nitrospirillum pindoramense]|uniref:Aminopeptidase n=1 Tax=Nitrospirillum amazonense TaxID=28077 RepID=A0A560HD22_9PROT|nr:M1 family metallopeptidase [Nitrospirillum amazonense]TWB44276.1 alanyl aminopeptidase [Nitrospirillum amazonense]
MPALSRLSLLVLILVPLLVPGTAAWGAARPKTAKVQVDDGAEMVPTVRLPDTARPLRYRLNLTIDPDQSEYSGQVDIKIALTKTSDHVWLNGRDLEMAAVEVVTAAGEHLPATWEQVTPDGVARVDFAQPLQPQTLTLRFTYSAPFDPSLDGLYRVSEKGLNYAFSQFEAISARQAWPCFDEPRFKTPYDITLTVKAGDEAVTNTLPVRQETLPGGGRRLTFGTTRPLPTYLLAFAVGPLDIVKGPTIPPNGARRKPIPVRGVALHGKGPRLAYALSVTPGLFLTLERYFGIPYAYGKLDLIAAPDFDAVGMENAGTILYSEQRLLVAADDTVDARRRFLVLHAHEIAHQWFGDLVTPAGWDDIWLNEAFASWLAPKAVDSWQPRMLTARMVEQEALEAMDLDSLASTRAIRQPITTTSDIETAFDNITYRKGAGVLAMMESYVGPAAFRKAVTTHLRRHIDGVATAQDFFGALADTMHDPVLVESLRSYINLPGVPRLSLGWTCPRTGLQVLTAQRRYRPLGSEASTAAHWTLPLCVQPNAASAPACMMVTAARQTFPLGQYACPAVLVPNATGTGYFRLSLTTEHWRRLLTVLPRLPAAEQMALLESLWGEVVAGHQPPSLYLTAAVSLAGVPAWDVASASFPRLKQLLDLAPTEGDRAALRLFLLQAWRPVMARVGLTPGKLDRVAPENTALLRDRLVAFLALELRDETVRAQLMALMRDPSAPPPAEVQATGMAVLAQELGRPYVDGLIDQVKTSTDAEHREMALDALNRVTDPVLAAQIRDLVFAPWLKLNEVNMLIRGQGRESSHLPAYWAWVQANIAHIRARGSTTTMGALPLPLEGLCSAPAADQVEAFFRPLAGELEGGGRTVDQAVERIRLCAAQRASTLSQTPPAPAPPPGQRP